MTARPLGILYHSAPLAAALEYNSGSDAQPESSIKAPKRKSPIAPTNADPRIETLSVLFGASFLEDDLLSSSVSATGTTSRTSS